MMPHSTAVPLRWIIVGLFLSVGSAASAQIQGMQAFDNRVEGTNVRNNALQDFTLIALHRDFQLFPQNATLHVRFFLPRIGDTPNKEVFVQAAELQDSFHYFMQAKNPKWKDGDWNVFEPWPTRDVIDRLSLQAGNIGVLAGYRIGNGPKVYLPVDVYQSQASAVPTYTFHFITGSDLQSLDISVTNPAGVAMKTPRLQQKCNKTYNPNCKLYAAGSSQSFVLDMAGLPPGEYHIKFLGHVPGDLTPRTLDIMLFHRP
jgi:hypothetical protein